MTNRDAPPNFWREALTVRGSVLTHVIGDVLALGAFSVGVVALNRLTHPHLGIDIAPYEIAGGVLALLLVLRTNAGYDRWWEARRLWGGIINQSRNLAVAALAYGPADPSWRDRVVRWTITFAHATRRSLRGERALPEADYLLGAGAAARVVAADHMPGYVALRVAEALGEGRDRFGMDPFAFLQADRERAALVDHLGGCERILKSPLPRVYGIEIRRFILLFLAPLPFALLNRVYDTLNPVVTMMVAYPLLALDRIGAELQNPFDPRNLGHLPLDELCATIERNLLALRDDARRA